LLAIHSLCTKSDTLNVLVLELPPSVPLANKYVPPKLLKLRTAPNWCSNCFGVPQQYTATLGGFNGMSEVQRPHDA